MDVSVIVVTYQGGGRIVNTLRSIENQTYKNFELIVLNDGSTDTTNDVLNREDFKFKQLTIIQQENRGRAGARNAAAKLAHGSLLIFYDDDMLLNPKSVEMHLSFHLTNPSCILVGNAPQTIRDSKNDFHKYRASNSQRWVSGYAETPQKLEKNNLFMTAANCSMSRAIFDNLHGFNEKLKDAEDKEFAFRAFTANISVFFHKKNIAWHDEKFTCKSYIMRQRQYAIANQHVYTMHPEFQFMNTKIGRIKRILYRILANRISVKIIDDFNIFILFPTSIRYKMYDAITFSLGELYPDTVL